MAMMDWLRDDHRNPSVMLAAGKFPIAIRRHPTARRLTMRLAPDGSELRITLPRWGRTRDALTFANSRTDWIEAQLARIPQRLDIAPGSALPFRGADVVIDWHASKARKPLLADGALVLGGPSDTIAPRVRRWLEAQALAHLAQDLEFYCQRADQCAPQLRLSRAQRRWGSCSGERHNGPENSRCIRINWRLIMAPDHVRRSVVAHEVAHLTHFDHSPAFHGLLAEIYDADISQADSWLKQQGRSLYAAFG